MTSFQSVMHVFSSYGMVPTSVDLIKTGLTETGLTDRCDCTVVSRLTLLQLEIARASGYSMLATRAYKP